MPAGRASTTPEPFFGEPHTIFVWGPVRSEVNSLVRLLAERFSPDFSLIEMMDPARPASPDPEFSDLAEDRALRVLNPASLLPDPAAQNLSAFVSSEGPQAPSDEVASLIVPEPIRGVLAAMRRSGTPNALAIVNSDRLGTFTDVMVREFNDVNRYLVGQGLALIIGHISPRVPRDEVPEIFDRVFEVIPGRRPGDEPVVSQSRSGLGGMLGTLVPWSEFVAALRVGVPAAPLA